MSKIPSYNRVWSSEVRPALCNHCHKEVPVWFISSRMHPELNGAPAYYCMECVVKLFTESMAAEGYAIVDVRGAMGVIIEDIYTDDPRFKSLYKRPERDN